MILLHGDRVLDLHLHPPLRGESHGLGFQEPLADQEVLRSSSTWKRGWSGTVPGRNGPRSLGNRS